MSEKSVIIRLVLFMSLFFLYQSASAQSLPDEVVTTYAAQNKPLKLVLKELSTKTGIQINFAERRIPANSKVSISAINEKLGTILTVILKPRKCKYEIIGDQIVVYRVRPKDENKTLTISGYIRDKVSGESLIGANVFLFDKSKGTQANDQGFYSFSLEQGTKRIYFSYLGYRQEILEVYLQKDTIADIFLNPDVQLNEVIILDDVENQEEPSTVSESKLNLDRILTSSSLGGETDVIRLVGMMPGVSSGADGLGGLNVRGGSADQNLVLLDGVPVYNPSHALGLFSVFNSNIIKDASLIKGNIPARYAGRLSSVLDIHTRDGNVNGYSGDVTISTLAGKGTIEGPIGKNGSSFILSARRTFLDPWIKSLTEYQNELNGNTGFTQYYFMDLNGKLSLRLNDRNKLFVSAFHGEDGFNNSVQSIRTENGIKTEDDSGVDWNWGNQVYSLKWTSQYSNKAFGRVLAYYTKYNFSSFEYDSFKSIDSTFTRRIYKAGYYASSIQDIALKYDFDYIPNPNHLLRSGIGAIQHDFSPGLISVNNSDEVFDVNEDITVAKVQGRVEKPELSGYEFFAFFEDEIKLSAGSSLNIGVHGNYTLTNENSFYSIQPRIAFLTKWDNAYFKAGATRMNQFLHLLSSNGLGLPTDVWLPSTDELAPETSWIFNMGVGYFSKSGVRLGIEGYYKIFDALTTYNEGGLTPISVGSNWEQLIPVGAGNAYGAEFNFDKIIGRTIWNANYALSFAFRDFDDLNINDEPFPFRYDRRHNAKIGFLHKITDNTEFVLNWNLSSGNPITKPSDQVVVIQGPNGPQLEVVYEEKNGGTLPTYHRLDVGFNFYNKYSWGSSKFTLGLYNTFNKNNPFFIDVQPTEENPNIYEEVQYSILPIIPSIGYSIYFK